MKAVVYRETGELPSVVELADPRCPPDGVVLDVAATGVCRSDWHSWRGHDPVTLPRVPGHEFAGTVIEVGGATRSAPAKSEDSEDSESDDSDDDPKKDDADD